MPEIVGIVVELYGGLLHDVNPFSDLDAAERYARDLLLNYYRDEMVSEFETYKSYRDSDALHDYKEPDLPDDLESPEAFMEAVLAQSKSIALGEDVEVHIETKPLVQSYADVHGRASELHNSQQE